MKICFPLRSTGSPFKKSNGAAAEPINFAFEMLPVSVRVQKHLFTLTQIHLTKICSENIGFEGPFRNLYKCQEARRRRRQTVDGFCVSKQVPISMSMYVGSGFI